VRKLFSILFIILLLFNILGYYGLFFGLEYTNDRKMIRKLDTEHYNTAETITLKIPIAIPYAADSRDFERIDGEFEHNGEFYRLVKQRLSNDTLYVVCIKDLQSKRINQALVHYVKNFTDKPVDNHHNTKAFYSLGKDYVGHTFSISHESSGWQCDVARRTSLTVYISGFYTSIIHPPECLYS
jgi:hypothetical protein